jgi:uncharacterized protein
MKEREDYFLEDLLSDTERELKELEETGGLFDSEDEQLDENAARRIREQFRTAEDEGVDFPVDGYMELTVSEDEMEVFADFYPPSEGMKPLHPDDAAEILNQRSIVFGVNWEEIQNTIFTCNTERRSVERVLIAEGKPPIREIPAHFGIEESLLREEAKPAAEARRIDYREISPFVLVKKGDVLARMLPGRKGEFGSTVFGKSIPYGTEKTPQLRAGQNTKREGGAIIAARDGRFELQGDEFFVNEVLQIESDVDYSTGNVNFPGDVILQGQIKDGFTIEAGGTIYCSQTMDASEVIGKKDLIVKQGIIGRKKGSIKVEGKIRAKFIENCYVEAGDTIYLDVGIINSAVYTSNRLELEKKGIIIGGTVYAQNGVTATQIGTETGPKTEIYCGIDYIVSNKLEWIRDNTVKLAFKLQQIEERLKTDPPQREQLTALRDKIKKSIHGLNEASHTLIYKLDKNEDAEIVVRGKIFPGVYLEICHVSYVVGREMSRSRFKLNKEKGIIVSEKLL